jgi:ribosomal protein L12E/L44/L45/RPP1/RPP2
MSDNYTDDTFVDTDETDDSQAPKALRDAANRAGKYKSERDTLRRENAFLKAGINSDDPRMSYFVKGYDGDLAPEAIIKAATDAGFLSQQQQTTDTTAYAAAQKRIEQASAGAVREGTTESAGLAQLEAAMREGGTAAMLEVARQLGLPVAN